MIRLAFKVAEIAAARESGASRIFTLGIARVTGGFASHGEIWYYDDITKAWCFSAREPNGTEFAQIDISDPTLWRIVEVPYPAEALESPEKLAACIAADYAWLQGRAGRAYNFVGIAAMESGQPITTRWADFCSQCIFEFLQDRRGMFPGWKKTEWIAPSGFGLDGKRFGLYELVTGTQKLPAVV